MVFYSKSVKIRPPCSLSYRTRHELLPGFFLQFFWTLCMELVAARLLELRNAKAYFTCIPSELFGPFTVLTCTTVLLRFTFSSLGACVIHSCSNSIYTPDDYFKPQILHTRSTQAMTTQRATRSPLLSQRRNQGRGGKTGDTRI